MTDKPSQSVDSVNMSIVDSRLSNIAREMGIVLMKTSYSTIFNEGLDFTCGLADAKGQLIGTGDFQPSMIGGLPLVMQTIAQEIPVRSLEDGDIIVHNDPYRGGMHTPEHTFVKPVFHKGELAGYSVSIGHVAEVGGMVPGAFAGEAREIFHEGLRVPPIKIRKAGRDVEDIWRLMLANYRTPRQNYGDFRALISAADLGERRFNEILSEFGADRFRGICANLLDYSERRMRAELLGFKEGHYQFEDVMEDDGVTDKPYRIAVDVYVMGGEIIVDFRRSDAQAKGPINAVLSVARSAAYNAVLHLTDPSIPKNSGCFRPIRVVAPPGRVVNCDYPAPEVGGNTETHIRICHTIIGALSQAAPERAFAPDGGTHSNFLFGGHNPRTGEYVVCYDLTSAGWGGRSHADGNSASCAVNGNSRMNPIEVFETRFPWLIREMKLIPDSGGAGQFRGGLSIEKRMVCRAEELTVSYMSDRQKVAPWGLFGGKEGRKAEVLIKRRGSKRWKTFVEDSGKQSPSKFSNVPVHEGDEIKIGSPGGGGYGPPKKRRPLAVEEDLRAGWITVAAAIQAYGRRNKA